LTGWTIDYFEKEYSFRQIKIIWRILYKYDMERRGFEFKPAEPSFEDLKKLYYTEEELKLDREMRK